jgi:hypothetical protein
MQESMDKPDFKKTLEAYRAERGTFRVVDVPEMEYLMIDGSGDPNTSPMFGQSVEVLYSIAYKLKFASKRELGRDYVVPPLEGLWWAKDMESFTSLRDKSLWDWTLLLLVPEGGVRDRVGAAVEQVAVKDGSTRVNDVRLESLAEGLCVQILHVGSFDSEAETLRRMHDEFIPGNGLRMTGKHHEIYLSDFRKVAPDKRRTILRQPVDRAEKR